MLLRKLSNKQIKIKKFTGNGCGKIVGKCRQWAVNLSDVGCSRLLVIHDLDQRKVAQIQNAIAAALHPCPIEKHAIVIPIKEIEAWFLADHDAITAAFNLKKAIPRIPNPEAEPRAKEKLGALIYRHSNHKTTYINAVDNLRIAKHVSIAKVRERCPSFGALESFAANHL